MQDEESTLYVYNEPTKDAETRGNWKNKYGNKGYLLFNSDSLENRVLLPDFIE